MLPIKTKILIKGDHEHAGKEGEIIAHSSLMDEPFYVVWWRVGKNKSGAAGVFVEDTDKYEVIDED